jgi:hypothetical protein
MNTGIASHQGSGAFAAALGGGETPLWSNPDIAALTRQATSNPFSGSMTATVTPGADMSELTRQAQSNPFAELNEQATVTFQAAMLKHSAIDSTPKQEEVATQKMSTPHISIQNVYVQAEDCLAVFDFYQQLIHATYEPQEEGV